MYGHGWDEARQRVKALTYVNQHGRQLRKHTGGSKESIMMQRGVFIVAYVRDGKIVELAEDPWFCKGVLLASTDTNALLEGLLLRMALPLGDDAAMQRYLSTCDYLILNLACDKAGANWAMCSWLLDGAIEPLPLSILPHCEPCGCHGTATGKHDQAVL